MVILAERLRDPLCAPVLRRMFAARKLVFSDLLGWNVPIVENRYEIDRFDDEHAVYLIVTRADGGHAASARLLPTLRPHILDSLFSELCAASPPSGPDAFEITRFCLDRRLSAADRLASRNILISALVAFALQRGISTYSGVAEMGWLQQILSFGWRCRPLGLPRIILGRSLGALRIDITADTPALLGAAGIYRPTQIQPLDMLEPA